VTVLVVSHVLSELEDLVDDVIFLLEGRVEFQGSLRRLEEITGESRLEPAVARLMQRKAS
jgi:Cu-processing system ATP-binding protein